MENKTSKYFKYAIGEIILVVIGILIALQINNWNENQKNNHRKSVRLNEIHNEFIINKQKLEFIVSEHKKCFEASQKLRSMLPLEAEKVNLDTLRKILMSSLGNWTYEPLQTRIKSFLGSSDFNLIKNKDLQEVLISWESVYEDFREDEQRAYNYSIEQLYPYLEDIIPFQFNLKDSRFDSSILETIQFESKFSTRYRALRDILHNDTNELERLQNTIQKIIDLTKPHAK